MKRFLNALVASVLLLLGTGLLIYPSAASWKAQWDQSHLIATYTDRVDRAKPTKDEQLAMARRYNAALASGAVLGENERIPSGTGSFPQGTDLERIAPYAQELNAGDDGFMARLRIEKIDVDLPVYHGTSDETLLKGAGHLEGTSLPVGGTSTRSVISAHRGMASATMFTNLDKVTIGDTFTIEVFGEVLTYRVISTKVVEPDASEEVLVEEGRDLVTLITCTPLGINTHRILVTGERVLPTPAADLDKAGNASGLPHFPWWALILTVVVLAISLYLVREAVLLRRARRHTAGEPPAQDSSISVPTAPTGRRPRAAHRGRRRRGKGRATSASKA
ncbi:class C sortase [Schaalia hyovaginalis]|uniref:class C sortase n=1 Tax=Schaalia hyovaginalis TaxID=29316 RepID=UPI002A7589CF|nr:class C sortase [Schaalia hyovaginalis]MDY2668644.1 class C sortase [Schaalia hyovaginalis]